jgi:hypothetical protein
MRSVGQRKWRQATWLDQAWLRDGHTSWPKRAESWKVVVVNVPCQSEMDTRVWHSYTAECAVSRMCCIVLVLNHPGIPAAVSSDPRFVQAISFLTTCPHEMILYNNHETSLPYVMKHIRKDIECSSFLSRSFFVLVKGTENNLIHTRGLSV